MAGLKAGAWHFGTPLAGVGQTMPLPVVGIQRGISVPKGTVTVCQVVEMVVGIQGVASIWPREL